jgi:DNA-binding transcriptional MerR regulator
LSPSHELVKLYYRIGEVAQIVGVQPHVLRYWETEFRTIRPQKSHKGQRVYSRRDVEKLLRVKDLLKNQGFTIAGARKKLRDPELAAKVEASLPEAEPAAVMAAARAVESLETRVESAAIVVTAPRASDDAAETRARMREALLSIREDLRAMLDDLETAPPRRPKLPSLP